MLITPLCTQIVQKDNIAMLITPFYTDSTKG